MIFVPSLDAGKFEQRTAKLQALLASAKLVTIAMEINIVRQTSYAAARAKDAGQRCDLEAGMAKLLAARVAWSAADNALQVHGGNGFAAEYPVSRLLCDARVLSIFEGAAEMQAQIISRRILDTEPSRSIFVSGAVGSVT